MRRASAASFRRALPVSGSSRSVSSSFALAHGGAEAAHEAVIGASTAHLSVSLSSAAAGAATGVWSLAPASGAQNAPITSTAAALRRDAQALRGRSRTAARRGVLGNGVGGQFARRHMATTFRPPTDNRPAAMLSARRESEMHLFGLSVELEWGLLHEARLNGTVTEEQFERELAAMSKLSTCAEERPRVQEFYNIVVGDMTSAKDMDTTWLALKENGVITERLVALRQDFIKRVMRVRDVQSPERVVVMQRVNELSRAGFMHMTQALVQNGTVPHTGMAWMPARGFLARMTHLEDRLRLWHERAATLRRSFLQPEEPLPAVDELKRTCGFEDATIDTMCVVLEPSGFLVKLEVMVETERAAIRKLEEDFGSVSGFFKQLKKMIRGDKESFEKMRESLAKLEEEKDKTTKDRSGFGSGGSDSGGGGGDGSGSDKSPMNQPTMKQLAWGAAALIAGALMLAGTSEDGEAQRTISFQAFVNQYLTPGNVDKLVVVNKNVVQVFTKDNQRIPVCSFRIGSVDHFEKQLEESQRLLGLRDDARVPVYYTHGAALGKILIGLAPTLLMMGAIYYLLKGAVGRRGGMGGGGGPGGIFNVGKSNAKRFEKQSVNITFADVAGCNEAKVEVMEFVEFLRDPKRFERLGAKSPKGALLVGPPGTGKTLLAKATAGEASVPFFSVSGSDFVEMFVGVGPARVRDLFAKAREAAPCILFIDEIDAVGRARGRSMRGGGNDERENTLNQILVEMDGMSTKSGVVVLAGTNRADMLDQALVRAGRFDRQIAIDLPDIKARQDIFMVHLKKLKLELKPEEYAARLASLTPGFSGADIANACNEAALVGARYGASAVSWKQFEQAIDRVIAGLERKTRILSPSEKRVVAYHEAGHAVAGWFLKHADPLLKVSIVPRGAGTLGFAQYNPADQHMYTRDQIMDRICMSLGGRVSEELNFGIITTGAADDLDKVTKMAYGSVVTYGMGSSLGPLSYRAPQEGDMTIGKPYSEDTASLIDDEVIIMVRQAYDRTKSLLQSKLKELGVLAELLIEREVVHREDVERILGKREFDTETHYRVAPPSTPLPGSSGEPVSPSVSAVRAIQ